MWLPLVLALLASAGAARAEPIPDFTREVLPILARYCLSCHGPDVQKGGLRLDRRLDSAFAGTSGRRLLEPGRPEKSELFRRVTSHRRDEVMPARGARLEPDEIERLRRWIASGATWPEVPKHWAWVKPVAVPLPRVSQPEWPRNAVDYFVLARLDREALRPASEADRLTLIRRLSLDLIGLPPTVEEADAFAEDTRPDAVERLVDRLLASPHYGERQARFWLDLARFADTNGYEQDRRRPIWPWRDWVISAFNRNLRFDEFTRWQMAGDLVPGTTDADRVATGFHRNSLLNDEGGINPEEFRVAAVMDRVETIATIWLGLTFNCAQCHDHKHDPVTMRDYYQLFAFLNHTRDSGVGLEPILRPAQPKDQSRVDWLRAEMDRVELELQQNKAPPPPTEDIPLYIRRILAKPRAQWTPKEQDNVAMWERVNVSPSQRALAQYRDRCHLEERALCSNSPPTLVLTELRQARPTHVLLRGNYRTTGSAVTPDVPTWLNPWPAGAPRNRLGLAAWLVHPDNPLVARVTMNRLWEQYFGRSLVPTLDDFGRQGEPCSHPELLDWLAVEFVRSGWDLKAMHRLVVLSATYRQSARITPELLDRDPGNTLLARGPRHRLEAEQIHDLMLMAGGRLVQRLGGPSVFPPQPENIWEQSFSFAKNQTDRWEEAQGGDRYRRGLYTFIRRTAAYPTALTFDMDNRTVCRVRRQRTNTPLQALTTLNGQLFLEAAAGLAERMLAWAGPPEAKLAHGFRRCVTRPPEPSELALLAGLLQESRAMFSADEAAARALLAHSRSQDALASPGEQAAWLLVANALLNLDETVTKN